MSIDQLTILRDQSEALIRAALKEQDERRMLERAVIDAINKYGASIDEVSDASGLAPREIRRILAQPIVLDELAALTGAC